MKIKKIHIHRFWQLCGILYLILAVFIMPFDPDYAMLVLIAGVLIVIASELVQIEVILERED